MSTMSREEIEASLIDGDLHEAIHALRMLEITSWVAVLGQNALEVGFRPLRLGARRLLAQHFPPKPPPTHPSVPSMGTRHIEVALDIRTVRKLLEVVTAMQVVEEIE